MTSMTWNDRAMIAKVDEDYVPPLSVQRTCRSQHHSSLLEPLPTNALIACEESEPKMVWVDSSSADDSSESNAQAQRSELIEDLASYDHCIVSSDYVCHVCRVFEVPLPYAYKQGLGAHYLAAHLCDKFKIAYTSKIGVGSALRECCDALRGYFKPATHGRWTNSF